METVTEVKKYLRENFDKGVKCPCCGQFVKLYKRKLTSTTAAQLIRMSKMSGWVHVSSLVENLSRSGAGDYSKLRFYGLIEEKINTDSKKRTSGFWRITDKGRMFVKNQIKVPSHLHLYNNVLMGFSETEISIIEALGNKFNYEELMNS